MALGEKSEAEPSLRDDLASALKDIEAREASEATPQGDEPPAPEVEAKVEPTETQTDRGDGRDAHGKFVAKPKEGEAAAETTSAAATDTPDTTQAASQDQTATTTSDVSTEADNPPKSWRADEAKVWAQLPPEAKAAVSRREADAARIAGQNDGERMFGREFAEVVRPHMGTINSFGVSPQQAVKALLESDMALRSGTPEQKLANARRLCLDYGIDPAQLAQPDPNAPSDPYVLQLQREIEQLKSRFTAPQGQLSAPLPPSPEEGNIIAEIEAFRADPAHPHFDAVQPIMGKLLETGAAPDLEGAYQMAVASDPALRFTAQPQRTQEEKTAAARRASASVTSSPGPTGTPRAMSLRDELAEGLRNHGFSV